MAARRKLTPAQRAAKREADRRYRQRKVDEAKAAGLPSAVAYGHSKRAGLPSVRELRSSGKLPAGRAPRPPRTRMTVNGPAGTTVHRTGSKAVAERLLRNAANAGQTIAFKGTFSTSTGFRHVTLDGRSSGQADYIAGGGGGVYEGGRGRLDTPTSRQGRSAAGGVIEVRVGKGGDVSAADVWEAWNYYADYFDDFWDFLAAWAEADYA